MKRWIFYTLVVFALLPVSCVKKKSAALILQEVERFIEFDLDSAAMLLAEVVDPERLPVGERASYAYLASYLHYKYDLAMTEDSMILFALDYFKEREVTEKLSIIYLLAASYYQWRDDEVAFREVMKEGIDFATNKGDSLYLSWMYADWARFESKMRNYPEAIRLTHIRRRYAPGKEAQICYNLGIYNSRMQEVDSAMHYFSRSLALHEEQGIEEQVSFVRRNYADFLTNQGRYREALRLNYKNIEEYNNVPHLSIVRNYIGLGELDSAQVYLNWLKEETNGLYISAANAMMATQAVINYGKGEVINWSALGQFNDSIHFKQKEDQKLLEEKITKKNELVRKNLLLNISRQRIQLYLTWGVFLFVVVCGGAGFYHFRKRRLWAETEDRRETLEQLLKESANTQEYQNRFSRKIVLQHLGLIRLVATTPTEQNQQLLRQVFRTEGQQTEEEQLIVWEDFYKVIDSVYNGFYSRVVSGYGEELSEKEVQLCCLLCAGFSTKEISVLTGQKFQTIYQRKTTIRQKLRMGEKEDIVAFVSAD